MNLTSDPDVARLRRRPRPPSSIQLWDAPARNLDWIAARMSHG